MLPNRGRGRIVLAVLVILLSTAAVLLFGRRPGQPSGPDGIAQQQPATAPDTGRSTQSTRPTAGPPRSYVEVIRAAQPAFPATQPLSIPLSLKEAAHVLLPDGLYVCPRGDLWIVRADAQTTAAVLRQAGSEQIHITCEPLVYVHWMLDSEGNAVPYLVCRSAEPGRFELVQATGRQPLPPRSYQWERAASWDDRIIVPTDSGISLLQVGPTLVEAYHELLAPPAAAQAVVAATSPTTAPARHAPVQFLRDPRGLLAWVPWEQDTPGSRGAARFVDGQWTDLGPEKGWPEQIVHLVPLLDGSVLQLIASGRDTVKLALAPLDAPQVDQKRITELVDQLSDLEPDKREAAYRELTRYGPGLWPVLEELLDSQPPEAQQRMHRLLQDRLQPTLGGMSVVDNRLQLLSRLPDGGAVFYAPEGVSAPQDGRDPLVIPSAWISIRPGEPIQLLDQRLTRDLAPGRSRLTAFQDEWVVLDEARGPCLVVGHQLVALLRKGERAQFARVAGVDRRGRWLFRAEPVDEGSPAAAPPSSRPTSGPSPALTLIIDPTLPDPTPRLPVWELVVAGGSAGWDQNDWPVIRKGAPWALEQNGWRPLKEKDGADTMFTEPGQMPSGASARMGQRPATRTTAPATAEANLGPVLLTDAEGRRYYDGRSRLRVLEKDGRQIDWPLPPIAVGSGTVHLIRSTEGLLFLFNQAGRVLRIRPNPEGSEPFVLEAVFTHGIPDTDDPTRVWQDQAGRIIVAYEGNRLAILFPSGRIAPEIQALMPAGDLKAALGDEQ